MGYTVKVVNSYSESTVQEVPVEGTDTDSVEIHNLDPLTSYTFEVCPMKTKGSGPAASKGGEIILLSNL